MKAKNQRLMLAALAIIAVIVAGAARTVGAQGPGGVLLRAVGREEGGLPLGKAVRLGGMVATGSIRARPTA